MIACRIRRVGRKLRHAEVLPDGGDGVADPGNHLPQSALAASEFMGPVPDLIFFTQG